MHYDAIMSTGYANEITDFRVRENSNGIKGNSVLIWVGAIFSAFILIIFNVCMARRGCENVYFEKHCIPKGQDVKPYYLISFVFEIVACLILYVISLIIGLSLYNDYISKVAIDIMVIVIPVTVMITEIICWYFNYSAVFEIKKKVKIEEERRKLQMKVEFTTNYSNLKSVPEDNDEHGIL
jgi:glucan phosphoethanolaminetransferase (alkaline phosphatase superfamily)